MNEMVKQLTKQERWEISERWRANAIIEKSIRDEKNVVDELTSHFVASRLIEELTGEEVVLNKKSRRQDPNKILPAWGKENAGREMTTEEIQESLGVSYSIAIKLLKNPDYFYKIKRGLYKIYDGAGDREAAKIATKKKVVAPATLI
jgi:hypothetical protein